MTCTFRKSVATLLVFALPAIFLFLIASPAMAASSASSNKCYIKYDKWEIDRTTVVATADPFDTVTRQARMRHSPRAVYRWCTRGYDPDTVQFLAIAWCSRKLDNREVPYVRGVLFNPSFFNNAGFVANPPEDMMKWAMFAGDYWDQKCRYVDFKNSSVVLRSSHPYWKITARVDIQLARDQKLYFADRHYLGYFADDTL